MSNTKLKFHVPMSIDLPVEIGIYHGKDAKWPVPYVKYGFMLETFHVYMKEMDHLKELIVRLREDKKKLEEALTRNEKRYICTECGRSFLWPRGNEDPWYCPLCKADIRTEVPKDEEASEKNDENDKCSVQIFDEFDLIYYWKQE